MSTETKCDQCGYDLTYTGNGEDDFLALSTMGKRHRSPPPIKNTSHFCGVGCLAAWIDVNYPNAKRDYMQLIIGREQWRGK